MNQPFTTMIILRSAVVLIKLCCLVFFSESIKTITDIAAVQGVILSSQLEEMLMNVNSQDVAQGMYKPIKLVYHPREPFYVIKQVIRIMIELCSITITENTTSNLTPSK